MKVKVYKDEDGELRPIGGIWLAEGRMAEYFQPDIDKFMKQTKGKGEVVVCELTELPK